MCSLPSPAQGRRQKNYALLDNDFSDDSDEEKFQKGMRDSAKAKLKNTNDSDDELDSARVFRVETLKMRKLQEQREE